MKLLKKEKETSIFLIPKNLEQDDKKEIIHDIKKLLLSYNKQHHFLEPGFYQIEVRFSVLVGTIISISLLDDFDFGSGTIDLRIILLGRCKVALEVEDNMNFKTAYLYEDKFYVMEEDLGYQQFFKLLEHGTIIIGEKRELIKKKGKKFVMQK